MIQFNNHNISAIEYNGHTIKKVYGACSNSPVWEYSEPVPPSTDGKFQYINSGRTRTIACNSSPSLTNLEIIQDMYNMDRNAHLSGMTDGIVGDCVTTIDTSCFNNWINLSSLTISSSVTSIGATAFKDCKALSSLTIPSGVTTIPSSMCNGCFRIASTNIPNGVTSIGILAYSDCLSLLNITIPASVTSIGDDAFRTAYWDTEPQRTLMLNMNANRRVTVLATTPPTLGTGVFSIMTGQEDEASYPIYVPAQSLNAYKTATNWSVYANRIFPIE